MRRRGERRARDVVLPRCPARRRYHGPGRVRDLVRWGHQRLLRGGGPAAMLTFIFAVTIPAPFSAVPARLAGWAFAAMVGIGAQLLLWPSRPDTGPEWRRGAGLPGAGRPGRGDIRARPAADHRPGPGGQDGGLRRRFLAAPHRPSGPTARRAALGSVVDELDWLPSLLAAPAQVPGADASPEETAAAVPGPWSRAAVPDVIGIRRLPGRGPRLAGRGPGLAASADSGEG